MSERVCAVVVTFNRKALLEQCLRALLDQTRPIECILVVDNASTDGTVQMVADTFPPGQFPQIETLQLGRNKGGAGGFHDGMKHAFERGFDWLWLMDDDGLPRPLCLERLLAAQKPGAVLVPLQEETSAFTPYGAFRWRTGVKDAKDGPYENITGEVVAGQKAVEGDFLFTFVGPLVSRRVVEQIGLPYANFFIYFDDIEYALRVQSQSDAPIIVVPDARFIHDFGAQGQTRSFLGHTTFRVAPPPWKLYYETRNYLYTVMYARPSRSDTLRYLLLQLRNLLGDALYEPDRRIRVPMRLRGIRDGATRRLGKRVSPRSSSR